MQKWFVSIAVRQDAPNLHNIAQVEEGSSRDLLNVSAKGRICMLMETFQL